MKRASFMAALAAVLALTMAAPATAAKNAVIFNSAPSQLPGNVTSQAFQATQTSQFGDAIKFAPGKRMLKKVTVVMSDWACETGQWNLGTCVTTPGSTFTQPIQLNIYGVNGANSTAPGGLLAKRTKKFKIHFRPSTNATKCPGAPATRWYSSDDKKCYNGFAQKITFKFGDLNLKVPKKIVYGIVYNTSGYGPHPYGYGTACATDPITGCPYDALNVGAAAGLPNRGTDLYPDGVFLDSDTGSVYCDNGAGGTGTFRLDDGCSTGQNPLVRFVVKK